MSKQDAHFQKDSAHVILRFSCLAPLSVKGVAVLEGTAQINSFDKDPLKQF